MGVRRRDESEVSGGGEGGGMKSLEEMVEEVELRLRDYDVFSKKLVSIFHCRRTSAALPHRNSAAITGTPPLRRQTSATPPPVLLRPATGPPKLRRPAAGPPPPDLLLSAAGPPPLRRRTSAAPPPDLSSSTAGPPKLRRLYLKSPAWDQGTHFLDPIKEGHYRYFQKSWSASSIVAGPPPPRCTGTPPPSPELRRQTSATPPPVLLHPATAPPPDLRSSAAPPPDLLLSAAGPPPLRRRTSAAPPPDLSSSAAEPPKLRLWQPGVDKLEEGEELECDITAYNSLHAFHTGWPCLSFDIVRDPRGFVRTEFPYTVYFVAGTQAGKAAWNSVGICKVFNVSGKRRDVVPKKIGDGESDMDDDSSDSDEDSDEDEAGGSKDPVLQIRRVAHSGSVNRIRAMSQSPHICATWSDSGYVQIWDVSSHLKALSESETKAAGKDPPVVNQAPLVNFKGHKDEGYALDWSPRVPGRMVSGDCRNCIHLWEPTSGTSWNVDPTPFVGHTASVEDLQVDVVGRFDYHKHPITSIEWSHYDDSTLAVSSADNQLTIWDMSVERDEEEEAEFKAETLEQVNGPADLPQQLLFVHQGQKDLKEIHWHSQIPGMIMSTASDGFNILMPSNI
ncbi:Protein HEAT STRESS TOLERANT DWD 1 [Linum perenne]